MTGTLMLKLLRDLRLPLVVVALLLGAFQCLWAKITQRISGDLMQQLLALGVAQRVTAVDIENTIFAGPGKIIKTFMGGESISLFRITDMLSVGYVHPLMLVIFCIWAVGLAAGAIAGEIDRGTMELLLAQPVRRSRILLAHLAVHLVSFPVLCLSLWAGNWLGIYLVDLHTTPDGAGPLIRPTIFAPALVDVALLMFAVGGYTMWLSAAGRSRGRVLGAAVFLTLLQFLINAVGQLWDAAAWLRPFTVFYYYQPQPIILRGRWVINLANEWSLGPEPVLVNGAVVLLLVGMVGYAMAWWTFCRRDLPAPL